MLLEDGKLRHYTITQEEKEEDQHIEYSDDEQFDDTHKPLFYDYPQGQYCIERVGYRESIY